MHVEQISSNDGKSDKLYIKSKTALLEPLQELCLPPDSFTITLLLDILLKPFRFGKINGITLVILYAYLSSHAGKTVNYPNIIS